MHSWKLEKTLKQLKSLKFGLCDSTLKGTNIIEVSNVTKLDDINPILIELYENTMQKTVTNLTDNFGDIFVKVHDTFFKLEIKIVDISVSTQILQSINDSQEAVENIEFLKLTSNGYVLSLTNKNKNSSHFTNLTFTGSNFTYYLSKMSVSKDELKLYLNEMFLETNNGNKFQNVGSVEGYLTVNEIVLPAYSSILNMTSDVITLINRESSEIIPFSVEFVSSTKEKLA